MEFDSTPEKPTGRGAEKQARHQRIQTLFSTGRHAEAIGELKAILLAHPDDVIARINLASAHDILGQMRTGLEEINRVLENAPREPQALFVKGRILGRLGKNEEAIGFLDESLKLRPQHRGALESRCKAYLHTDNNDQCIQDCDELIGQDPTNPSPYLHRGWAHLQKNDLKSALPDLNEAIRLRPDYPLQYTVRAQAKIEMADLGGALDDANRAIDLSPSKPVGYSTRAMEFEALGRDEDAARDLESATRLRGGKVE